MSGFVNATELSREENEIAINTNMIRCFSRHGSKKQFVSVSLADGVSFQLKHSYEQFGQMIYDSRENFVVRMPLSNAG